MAHAISMGCIVAPTQSTTDNPETIRLHGLASNALATALSLLNRQDTTPAQLQQATARAVRAATLLKRASMAANLTGEVAA